MLLLEQNNIPTVLTFILFTHTRGRALTSNNRYALRWTDNNEII